ncbi:GGDEF domain-containing protein [Candidatus Blastococcus massiliensis]|uniref:GGDEF domain-containing protein n=1 Tax=Candidatus Blastococcus massiliensis TaxID=1470358 RepID=UPI0004B77C13|nr:GGDEF domain-containing protein [Candidatus Blastococcus massiliensis]
MPIAPNHTHAVPTAEAAVADVTALLPTREALLDRLAERLASPGAPASLLIVGLLRRDDGWPLAATTRASVTMLLARSLRGDDWLGSPGAGEFAIVLDGPETAAETAGARLTAAVAALGIDGLTAAAGIAPLTAGLQGPEVFRRATLSLTAARRVGSGTVLRYREPA